MNDLFVRTVLRRRSRLRWQWKMDTWGTDRQFVPPHLLSASLPVQEAAIDDPFRPVSRQTFTFAMPCAMWTQLVIESL